MNFIEPIDYVNLYGPQTPSPTWETPAEYPPSPHRIRHLPGCPSPEAMYAMFSTVSGKGRKILERRYFGAARRGPR